jgi:hypothetical protein
VRTNDRVKQAGIAFTDGRGRPMRVHAASWRTGGVRRATDTNVSEPLIMELGRWSGTWFNLSVYCTQVSTCVEQATPFGVCPLITAAACGWQKVVSTLNHSASLMVRLLLKRCAMSYARENRRPLPLDLAL